MKNEIDIGDVFLMAVTTDDEESYNHIAVLFVDEPCPCCGECHCNCGC